MSAVQSKSFRFKQFLVQQENCSMRVNTDGCLLAAWVNPSGNDLLDVGSGSGVISLMLAQRNVHAHIIAIDIDPLSCADGQSNFDTSQWGNRLQMVCDNFLEWPSDRKFDLIISNPPFFSNGVKPSSQSRRLSRHSETLPADEFLKKAAAHLNKMGRIAIIVPITEFGRWEEFAMEQHLKLGRVCFVHPDDEKPVHRVMAELGMSLERTDESLKIRNAHQEYSEEFISLLRDFYLHF